MFVALVRYNPAAVPFYALRVIRERLAYMVPMNFSVEGIEAAITSLQIWMLPCDEESALISMGAGEMGIDYNPGKFDYQIILITKYHPERQRLLEQANERISDLLSRALHYSNLDLKGCIYTICVPAAFNEIG